MYIFNNIEKIAMITIVQLCSLFCIVLLHNSYDDKSMSNKFGPLFTKKLSHGKNSPKLFYKKTIQVLIDLGKENYLNQNSRENKIMVLII